MSEHAARLAEVEGIEDPLERASHAHALFGEHDQARSEASRVRREAIEVLTRKNMSNAEIGAHLGLSRARVSAMLKTGPSPERALLSHDGGSVTVAIGAKKSQVGDQPSTDMVSSHVTEGYDLLKTTLGDWNVATHREVLAAPGLDLEYNRDRLVVIGSPKVLPFIGQMLAADPRFGFGDDGTHRYLTDRSTGQTWYSPRDDEEPADIGYVGRVARPDGKGAFFYFAGIHAVGTHGAIRYVVDNMAELYKTVGKDKLFSMLVRSEAEAEQPVITRTEALTDIHVR